MKRIILVLLLILSASGLFAEAKYKKEIYRNLSYDKELFLFEIYDDNDEIIYYEIKTNQGYSNSTTCFVRSYDKKALTKLLNNLRLCNDKDFKKYLQNNKDVTFLWDNYDIVANSIKEYFCYSLE